MTVPELETTLSVAIFSAPPACTVLPAVMVTCPPELLACSKLSDVPLFSVWLPVNSNVPEVAVRLTPPSAVKVPTSPAFTVDTVSPLPLKLVMLMELLAPVACNKPLLIKLLVRA